MGSVSEWINPYTESLEGGLQGAPDAQDAERPLPLTHVYFQNRFLLFKNLCSR